jgi:hypothetical protein
MQAFRPFTVEATEVAEVAGAEEDLEAGEGDTNILIKDCIQRMERLFC